MACFFGPKDLADERLDTLVRVTSSQPAAQVVFRDAKQTCPQLAVGGQPETVTMPAKRFADRGDDANFAWGIGEAPAPGSFGGIGGRHRLEVETGLKPGQDFTAGND